MTVVARDVDIVHITYITDPLVAAVSATRVFLTIGVVLVLERLLGLDRLLGTR